MPVAALPSLGSASTVEAITEATRAWVLARHPKAEVRLLVTERGTGRLLADGPARKAHEAHLRGEEVVAEDGDRWEWWIPLRGLGGPLGVLGVGFPRGAAPAGFRRVMPDLAALVALALERVRDHASVGVLRDAMESLADRRLAGVVVASERAEVLVYSPGMERLTGWTAEEVGARGFFDLLYPDPAQRARAVVAARETFRGAGRTDPTWWLTHRDGRAVPVHLETSRVVGPDQTRYLVAVFVDRSGDERQVAEAHHAELGRFAAAVNHDFNNLLAVVQGHAEVLREVADPAVRRHAESLLQVSARGARLTRQLAAFGRDQPLFRIPAELGPLCDDALRQFRQSAPRAAIAYAAAPDLPVVELDAASVKHLLLNLLENAGESAGPTGRVSVDLRRAEPPPAPLRGAGRRSATGWVRLRVTDDGPGFSAEARSRLFEPFYTTKGVGHGLGLAAVGTLADGLHAVVDVPHQIGRGAIVDVYLPVAPGPPRSAASQRDPGAGGDETIWLVDDDPAVLEVLALGLESFGYVVRRFADPSEVLVAVDAGERVDLLVSDLVMPGLDGVGLYQGLRARGNPCAVLFVSGFAKSGVDVPQEPKTDFAHKPVSARLLAEKARRLLNYVLPA